VTEKLTTIYVKADIDTTLGSLPLTGNIGVQSEHAEQTANLFFTDNTVINGQVHGAYQDVGRSYTFVLPSLNLALGLADDLKLRFAAAKTEARPRMDEMAGGAGYSTLSDQVPPLHLANGTPVYWTQNSGGNPRITPWRADAFDLALEKYFANRGYVSAALYYKNLTSYIYPNYQIINFAGVPLPPPQAGITYNNADANRIGYGTIEANGNGGHIKGAEVAVSVPLDVVANALNGFGILISASWNQSSIHPQGVEMPIPGLSPSVINSTLYYENGGFSIRVSDRRRGGFIGEVPAYDASLTINNVKSESVVDAQVGYSWEEGALKGLSVNLSGSNLTNEPFVLYNVGAPAFDVIKYEKYGATYALQLRYKF
jgi:iron complex outermembrane receptor protein